MRSSCAHFVHLVSMMRYVTQPVKNVTRLVADALPIVAHTAFLRNPRKDVSQDFSVVGRRAGQENIPFPGYWNSSLKLVCGAFAVMRSRASFIYRDYVLLSWIGSTIAKYGTQVLAAVIVVISNNQIQTSLILKRWRKLSLMLYINAFP